MASIYDINSIARDLDLTTSKVKTNPYNIRIKNRRGKYVFTVRKPSTVDNVTGRRESAQSKTIVSRTLSEATRKQASWRAKGWRATAITKHA